MARPLATLRPLRSLLVRPSLSSTSPIAASSRHVISTMRTYSTATEGSEGKKEEAAASAGGSEAERIASLEARVKELEKDILYTRAEAQTQSRRVIEERNKASEYAISKFAKSLLETSDILHQALKSVPQHHLSSTESHHKPLKDLHQGVELTHKALLGTFGQHNVKRYEKTLGEKFDPNLHEAVFQVPKEVAPKKHDGGEWSAGEVFEVQKEGWKIGDRVLRPAQVGVTQIE